MIAKGSQVLRQQYKNIFCYLKRHRQWCGITLLVIVELLVFALLKGEPDDSYRQYVAETAGKYRGEFSFIFWENLQTLLRVIAVGTVPLFLGTFVSAFGVVTSLVATGKWLLPDVGATRMLVSVLPHGIFEIPAIYFSILLSALWSRAVTAAIVRLIRRRPVIDPLKEDILSILKCIIFIELPLVLVAAIIEAI